MCEFVLENFYLQKQKTLVRVVGCLTLCLNFLRGIKMKIITACVYLSFFSPYFGITANVMNIVCELLTFNSLHVLYVFLYVYVCVCACVRVCWCWCGAETAMCLDETSSFAQRNFFFVFLMNLANIC